jgi:sulfotransferase
MIENMIKSGFFSQIFNNLESKTFYFMAGLPRSGSTVLSTLLNQNPRFYSGPSSPVLVTMYAVENHLLNDELFNAYPKPEQAKNIISSIISQFYEDIQEPVVIDKNRAWTARVPYIEGYIGQKAKIICPVRDIDEILTSMIMMIRRNPYQEGQGRINFIDEQLVKLNIPLSDDNRCEYIAGPEGILGQSLNAIVEGFKPEFADRIHFVEYKDLVNSPEETLKNLYEFLSEEPYEHTFDNLENKRPEQDLRTYGLGDMHEVHKELKSTAPDPTEVLSENILKKCKGMDIWRQSNQINSSQLKIIT